MRLGEMDGSDQGIVFAKALSRQDPRIAQHRSASLSIAAFTARC
jgi:hypothetical protein